MVTPEIETGNISYWWIWQNMGLDAMLNIAQATGHKARAVSDERMEEVLNYFENVEVGNDE